MILDNSIEKYQPKYFDTEYKYAKPLSWIQLQDFLPSKIWKRVTKEIDNVKEDDWYHFTRNDSHMKELFDYTKTPIVDQLMLEFNSSRFITWLEQLTGLTMLIPDPHHIGGGIMRCTTGDHLKIHTDFNWNEQLHLNRVLTVIVYVSKEWKREWQGNLQFKETYDSDPVVSIEPTPNSILIFEQNSKIVHGHPIPITCPDDQYRDGIRVFYYQSNSTPNERPHRSLYWYDKKIGMYDKKDQK
jgi:Rps23 Pro-64 3,4-dihydroxylase Tpa1-like proline 4-hydroxylase